MGFALSGTLLGTGPFVRPSSTESLVLLQLYTSVLALTGLVLGAVTVERQRSDRQRAAVHATASLLAAATPLAQVSNQVLRAICENLERDVGALWGVDRAAGVMRCLGVWSRPGVDAAEFLAVTRASTFARGVGLPGPGLGRRPAGLDSRRRARRELPSCRRRQPRRAPRRLRLPGPDRRARSRA